ncbi:vesicle transport protein USE1 isoform X4 [Oryctolagus cuniculus]|uniref:vesicle transport protein USE1 isoform X4 n=1 Tax=Oryctolagus cuniculus TaxID=9986 RepID=UPI003878F909
MVWAHPPGRKPEPGTSALFRDGAGGRGRVPPGGDDGVAAGAEPGAAALPLRGHGGGKAGSRGVASGEDLVGREGAGQPVPDARPRAHHGQGASAGHQDRAPAVAGALHQRDAERAAGRLAPGPDVRKRTAAAGPRPAAELDLALQRQQDLQERLSEEMLGLARSLKSNTLAAQGVIKRDNQTLSHSIKMADQNLEKLKAESERLEQHAQKSVNWLLWAMLIVVCSIFISMILFIRVMPKLK